MPNLCFSINIHGIWICDIWMQRGEAMGKKKLRICEATM